MNLTVFQGNLPKSYEAARTALAQCQAIDECKEWADKSAALASYARQAEDFELEQMAARIRARAMRRAGELAKQMMQPNGTNRFTNHRKEADLLPMPKAKVQEVSGFSEWQLKSALRIANIPQADFDKEVESQNPPQITALAMMGMKTRPMDPQDWLKGRDPKAFNMVLHFVGAVERYAKELAGADLTIILANLTPRDVERLRGSIAQIDPIHDQIVTRI